MPAGLLPVHVGQQKAHNLIPGQVVEIFQAPVAIDYAFLGVDDEYA
jgi:hypothetical protein